MIRFWYFKLTGAPPLLSFIVGRLHLADKDYSKDGNL